VIAFLNPQINEACGDPVGLLIELLKRDLFGPFDYSRPMREKESGPFQIPCYIHNRTVSNIAPKEISFSKTLFNSVPHPSEQSKNPDPEGQALVTPRRG